MKSNIIEIFNSMPYKIKAKYKKFLIFRPKKHGFHQERQGILTKSKTSGKLQKINIIFQVT